MPREREKSAASRAIIALAMGLAARRPASDGCTVELMFVLPDSEAGPLFEGMRLRAYQESEHVLIIEAAVPSRLVDSEHAARYIAAATADAIDAARDFFEEKQTAFDAERHHALLADIESEIGRPIESRDLPESTWVDATGMTTAPPTPRS
jgi:hypothetical protein